MVRSVIAVVLAALVSLLPLSAAAQESERVMVFAAASLTDALQEIGTAYGRIVVLTDDLEASWTG